MLNNSIDIYNGVLAELNKEYNASFETWDYVFFLNKAVYEWVKLKYKEYETTQKRTDDLQVITNRNTLLQLDKLRATLPSNYLFLLGVRAEVKGKTKCEDAGIVKECYKMTSDRKGYELSNYYGQLKNWYEITKDAIYLIPEKNTTIDNIYIEYIEKPDAQNIDIDNPSSTQNNLIPLLQKEYIAIEIIKLTASMFLESIEQQRTQGHIQLNNQLLTN